MRSEMINLAVAAWLTDTPSPLTGDPYPLDGLTPTERDIALGELGYTPQHRHVLGT